MLTKAEARTAIRDIIDDPSGKFWSNDSLDKLASRTIDGLWSDVLDLAPYMVTQLEEPGITSPGYIDLRLTTTGGQLTQRFYRVQKVTRNGVEYREAKQIGIVIEDDVLLTGENGTYAFYGNQLWLFPLDPTTAVELRYNFLPTPFTSLTDGYIVPWPDGYDDAYIYGTARRAFAKGDAESINQATQLYGEAMTKLTAAIRKNSFGPVVPFTTGTPAEWGA